jgi:zinc protease
MQKVFKKILDNGLTILIYPSSTIPKVAVQLWYGVGSKDEKDGQRGLAHLLEHMIFKGTSVLSESDINMISHKLSGNCNAFTSHDYTGYLFDFPKQNWHHSLPLLADCMRNCTFKEDLLNAELKAVIQELKMYKDDYKTSLAEEMLSAIFQDHPYHYPIIGYKQDLWNITREGLLDFYRQHYVPNNATLIIVGDVDVDSALNLATAAFDSITASPQYKKEQFPFAKDMCRRTLTMRRDVQQPSLAYAWIVPGLKQQKNYITDIASWILGEGKGSRLYRKLVDERELATDLQVDLYELFDANVLFLNIDPIDEESIEQIEAIIAKEVDTLANEQASEQEIMRAHKQAQMEHISLFEGNQKIAYELGKIYLATHDENALFGYPILNVEQLKHDVQNFFKEYVRTSVMHKGALLPFIDTQQEEWLALQEQADKLDEKILSRKVRESTVECGVFVEQIVASEPTLFVYPKATKNSLSNGLEVLEYSRNIGPKIDLVLDLKMRNFYDPEDKQGLLNFMMEMLEEGTRDYTEQELADAAEARGISINVQTGLIGISLLKEDLEFGLSLLEQLLCKATFPEKSLSKVRQQIASEIDSYWDTPTEFAGQLARDTMYGKDHPYHKNLFGTKQTISKITREDLLNAYKKYICPQQASLAVVGDLQDVAVMALIQKYLGDWQGRAIEDLSYPNLPTIQQKEVVYPINRDQTVLCFTGKSTSRLDPEYDSLLLFDQVLTGGVLGSMSSFLFKLREQTGLFYTIGGSIIAGADEQPGLVFIKTIVSNDRLEQAEKLIAQTLDQAKDMITQEDLDHARNAIINSMVDNFESNDTTAQALLFISRFKLKPTYFDDRIVTLKKITLEEVKNNVSKILDSKKLLRIKVGRV